MNCAGVGHTQCLIRCVSDTQKEVVAILVMDYRTGEVLGFGPEDDTLRCYTN